MSYVYYLGDYGPVTADVTDFDGSPITPISGAATVVNQHTGETVVANASAAVAAGTITYQIPEGSPITDASARYVVYLTAELDETTKVTSAVVLDVLDKASYMIVDRWRRKVEFAAPNLDALSDQEGRDWIDQAVSTLNGQYYDTGYTSVLGSLTPNTGVDAAGANEIEYFASVAALMARTAWWAGKGNWRDEEMSLDTGPFFKEWESLKNVLTSQGVSEWYNTNQIYDQHSMFNRDKTDAYGFSDQPDRYYDASWWNEE
jgi:hypothetical protein